MNTREVRPTIIFALPAFVRGGVQDAAVSHLGGGVQFIGLLSLI